MTPYPSKVDGKIGNFCKMPWDVNARVKKLWVLSYNMIHQIGFSKNNPKSNSFALCFTAEKKRKEKNSQLLLSHFPFTPVPIPIYDVLESQVLSADTCPAAQL